MVIDVVISVQVVAVPVGVEVVVVVVLPGPDFGGIFCVSLSLSESLVLLGKVMSCFK